MGSRPNFRLEFIAKADYLFFKVSGEWSAATRFEVLTRIAHECRGLQRSSALIDLTDTDGVTPVQEIYDEVKTYVNVGLNKLNKLAIVQSPSDRKSAKFRELIAQNRGFPMKVFLNLDEAEAWLNAKPVFRKHKQAVGL